MRRCPGNLHGVCVFNASRLGATSALLSRSRGRRRNNHFEVQTTGSHAPVLEWTRCESSSATAIEQLPPFPACLRACSLLPGCPPQVVTFFDYHGAPPTQRAPVLAEHLRGARTLRSGGGGRRSATAAAQECPSALLLHWRHSDRFLTLSRMRANTVTVVDYMYIEYPAMCASLRAPHGPDRCTC